MKREQVRPLLLSLFLSASLLSACARVPEVKSPVTIEDVNAATADPNFGGMFLMLMVVMILLLVFLSGSFSR